MHCAAAAAAAAACAAGAAAAGARAAGAAAAAACAAAAAGAGGATAVGGMGDSSGKGAAPDGEEGFKGPCTACRRETWGRIFLRRLKNRLHGPLQCNQGERKGRGEVTGLMG
ncbi:unnamed protein product [Closterium sp. NIES-54]